MKRRIPTVRGIRAILREAGVPLSEYKAEVKRGPRHRTVGAWVYSPASRRGMLLDVVVEWCDGRFGAAQAPEPVRAALDAAGYVTNEQGLVLYKETP